MFQHFHVEHAYIQYKVWADGIHAVLRHVFCQISIAAHVSKAYINIDPLQLSWRPRYVELVSDPTDLSGMYANSDTCTVHFIIYGAKIIVMVLIKVYTWRFNWKS